MKSSRPNRTRKTSFYHFIPPTKWMFPSRRPESYLAAAGAWRWKLTSADNVRWRVRKMSNSPSDVCKKLLLFVSPSLLWYMTHNRCIDYRSPPENLSNKQRRTAPRYLLILVITAQPGSLDIYNSCLAKINLTISSFPLPLRSAFYSLFCKSHICIF